MLAGPTLKLGYNQLGYSKQIFPSYTNQSAYNDPNGFKEQIWPVQNCLLKVPPPSTP